MGPYKEEKVAKQAHNYKKIFFYLFKGGGRTPTLALHLQTPMNPYNYRLPFNNHTLGGCIRVAQYGAWQSHALPKGF